MERLDIFLARHPPFDALSDDELADVAASARVVALDAGETALVEDGPPATAIWVILDGMMELVHEGEVVEALEPGECFGHPSLLSGMAPTFTVRAREPTRCALIDGPRARRLLGTVAGAHYVAGTMRRRMTEAGHTVHGLRGVGTTPVSAIMRPPRFADPETSLRDAAATLGEPGVSALLVALDGSYAILTDAHVRAAVAAGDSLESPVRAVVGAPGKAVPAAQLAIEATVDMLDAGVEHVAVLDGERVCGVLSAADLLGLDARSPIALRHSILGARDPSSLRDAAIQLPALFLALARANVSSRDLGRVLSLQHDAVVTRLIEFAIAQHGPAPVAWTWLDLGSAARRELTLASDQDNALAYGDPDTGSEQAVDAYFARLGADVNDGLGACGIGVDSNGVLARERRWRMSKPAWLQTFDAVLTEPSESHLVRATVAFDFRTIAGALPLTAELTARIRTAPDHPQFMRLIARTATGYPVALRFRSQLATDADGRVDIKRGAIVPLVNLVRYHALAVGVTISSTPDRIEAASAAGGLAGDEAAALAEAYDVITRVRFEHHEALIGAGHSPDNRVDPGTLTPIARSDLREALAAVRRAQRRLPT
ncbi:MAG TPA: putative nucleotidyltransferase substrate binding domain-containing protein [Solirubrobacteraceae bacterium]|nr:putative nucleotidyltransferase substrate binding domain-containing protein [Solirubrobacteraceae bacterium]